MRRSVCCRSVGSRLATTVTSAMPSAESMQQMLQWQPQTNKLHCALRDLGYAVVDTPYMLCRSSSNYGVFRRYLRRARANKGKVDASEFADMDGNVLRSMLADYQQTRGPLQRIDLRVVTWVYCIMFGCILWKGREIANRVDALVDRDAGDGSGRRRSLYSDDYIEDIRTR